MPKRYLIYTKSDIENAQKICAKHKGVRILHCHRHFPLILAEIDDIKRLSRHPDISHIEEDIKIQAHRAVRVSARQPNVTFPWNIEMIKAPSVWPKSMGRGVRVGVLDTGIDYTHPALRGRVAGGYNAIAGNRHFMDDNGHGTHIAGIIASSSRLAEVYGVSPRSSLYAIKVMNKDGSGRVSDTVRGIEWAIENNIQVLNMSLGSSQHSVALEQATRKASQKGMILVASAGNGGSVKELFGSNIDYPARFPWVISVGAVDKNMKRADFSSMGGRLDIMAPGVDIRSTWPGGKYKAESGTSMSAAHVSGAAALLLARYQGMDGIKARNYLLRLNRRMGWRSQYGKGLLNLSHLSR
ncbi:S8 family peptidase [Aneurinibacillus sp. BA2021]|nr:S8 family peptidase [Aneurinibacillus sp. BA2021]